MEFIVKRWKDGVKFKIESVEINLESMREKGKWGIKGEGKILAELVKKINNWCRNKRL